MVNALCEAHRVLTPPGVLIDVRPVTAPIVLEVVIATTRFGRKRSAHTARKRTWKRPMPLYSLLYRANGLSSTRVFRSLSRSIAIAPPSCASMPRRENYAGPRSLMRSWKIGCASWARKHQQPLAMPLAMDAQRLSQEIARPISPRSTTLPGWSAIRREVARDSPVKRSSRQVVKERRYRTCACAMGLVLCSLWSAGLISGTLSPSRNLAA